MTLCDYIGCLFNIHHLFLIIPDLLFTLTISLLCQFLTVLQTFVAHIKALRS